MIYKKYIPRSGLKKHTIPEQSLSQTTTSQLKANADPNDDRSDFEKYLNFYESINQKQTSDSKQNLRCFIMKNKNSHQIKKGIFQNPLIQNSCPKTSNQINQEQLSMKNQQYVNQKIQRNEVVYERVKTIPSKKNQMALKMIAQNKVFSNQKSNASQTNILIRGSQMIQSQDNRNLTKYYSNPHKDNQSPTKQNFSFWKNNCFFGSDVNKAYSGYYKAKNKKKYEKQREKRLRNSTAFISQIDKSIQHEKQRQLIMRSKTNKIKDRNIDDFQFNCANLGQKRFGNQQKILKTQSEARLSDFQKNYSPNKNENTNYFELTRKQKSNTNKTVGFLFNGQESRSFQRKNSKKYPLHQRIHHPSQNSSVYGEFNKSVDKSLCMLSVTTQAAALKEIIFLSMTSQQIAKYGFKDKYSHSKKILQKKYLKNPNKGKLFDESGSKNHSMHENRIQRRSHQITLNKIQESIQKDVQIIIQKINVKR